MEEADHDELQRGEADEEAVDGEEGADGEREVEERVLQQRDERGEEEPAARQLAVVVENPKVAPQKAKKEAHSPTRPTASA